MAVLDVLQSFTPGLGARASVGSGAERGGSIRRSAIPGGSAELSVPHAEAGEVPPCLVPTLVPVLPPTLSPSDPQWPRDIRGCYPASEVGVRGGGMFCSPCAASNRNQVMPGVIGSPLRQSPGGRSESTAQAERPESRVLRAAAQEPASERSPGGSAHSAEEFSD